MNWHYVENGKQIGPITEEQLLQLHQAGNIGDETLVWREGLSDWMPYRQAQSPGAQPSTAAPSSSGAEREIVCAECGKLFPVSETIQFGKARVCAACKPVFLQKLSEGAQVNTGDLAYATIPTRFAAVFLDGLILGAVSFGMSFVIGLFFAVGVGQTPSDGKVPVFFLTLQIVLMAVNTAIGVSYEGFMIGKYGATLGKMACKIKVVTADGGKVGYGRAFGRYFAKMLSAFTCLIGYIMACFDDQKRALHDRICDTRVVTK